MPIFICQNCNKEFNRKSNYVYHVENKKRPCNVLENKNNCQNIKNESELAKNEPKIAIQEPKIAKKKIEKIVHQTKLEVNTSILDIENKINPYDIIMNNVKKDLDNNIKPKHICSYCNNSFNYKSSLIKHMKARCKSKKYYDELEILKEKLKTLSTENEQLKKEMTELKHTGIVNNNTTNNTTNNINNTLNKNLNKINNGVINNNNNNNTINVQLVQFGNENIDHIDTKEALDVYLKSTGGNIVSNILKLINLNEKYPENHNICISDLSRELVKIFDGKKFIIKKFKNVKGDILGKVIKNTYRIVDKIENDKFIKKTPDIKSKMKINNVSLKLIDGCPAEDIVREEIRENEKLLKYKAENNKNLKKQTKNIKNDDESESENENDDSDSEEEREFNLEELLRIEHLENKQPGLLEIALERLKEELYNGKIIICE